MPAPSKPQALVRAESTHPTRAAPHTGALRLVHKELYLGNRGLCTQPPEGPSQESQAPVCDKCCHSTPAWMGLITSHSASTTQVVALGEGRRVLGRANYNTGACRLRSAAVPSPSPDGGCMPLRGSGREQAGSLLRGISTKAGEVCGCCGGRTERAWAWVQCQRARRAGAPGQWRRVALVGA